MKSENDIITDDELEKITGFQVANKQVEKLIEAGVWFVKNREGKPRTTWYHFNHPLKFRTTNSVSEPDWGAMGNGKWEGHVKTLMTRSCQNAYPADAVRLNTNIKMAKQNAFAH